jgi:hypothetical protein
VSIKHASAPIRIGQPLIATRRGTAVLIRPGWSCAGRQGIALGDYIVVKGQAWTPILWKGDDDPSFEKTAALELDDRRNL